MSTTKETKYCSTDDTLALYYFSAHWCPPCRGFTPQLAQFYLKANEGDSAAAEFSESLKKANEKLTTERAERCKKFEEWATKNKDNMPKSSKGTPLEFTKEIKIQGRVIPGVPCNKCRKGITIAGGAMVCIADQYALCYYCTTGEDRPSESEKPSASHFAGSKCVIKFMSGDQDEGAYNAYFASMPWMSDGYNRNFYQQKMKEFGIQGIPTFVLLKKDGTMASKDCRGDVMGGMRSPEALQETLKKWKGLI